MVVCENPSRSVVFEILRPARLAPTTIAHSKSLKSHFLGPLTSTRHFRQHTDINTTDVSIKQFSPLNILPLTLAIQHHSIIESYQYEHLIDLKQSSHEPIIINDIFSPSAEIYRKLIVTNSKLNIDEPLKVIKVINFPFVLGLIDITAAGH